MLAVTRFVEGNWDEDAIREVVLLTSLGEETRDALARIACGAPHETCIWGRLQLRREQRDGGLRFWIEGCANSLAWTVLHDKGLYHRGVQVHVSMDGPADDPTLSATVHDFADAVALDVAAALRGERIAGADSPAYIPCGRPGASSRFG